MASNTNGRGNALRFKYAAFLYGSQIDQAIELVLKTMRAFTGLGFETSDSRYGS